MSTSSQVLDIRTKLKRMQIWGDYRYGNVQALLAKMSSERLPVPMLSAVKTDRKEPIDKLPVEEEPIEPIEPVDEIGPEEEELDLFRSPPVQESSAMVVGPRVSRAIIPSIGTEHLKDAAVTSEKIADGAITSEKIGPGVRILPYMQAGMIDTIHLLDGAVTAAKLADGVVGSATIEDGSVTTAKLDTGAVTTAKLANDSVTFAKMGLTSLFTYVTGSSASVPLGSYNSFYFDIQIQGSNPALSLVSSGLASEVPLGALVIDATRQPLTSFSIADNGGGQWVLFGLDSSQFSSAYRGYIHIIYQNIYARTYGYIQYTPATLITTIDNSTQDNQISPCKGIKYRLDSTADSDFDGLTSINRFVFYIAKVSGNTDELNIVAQYYNSSNVLQATSSRVNIQQLNTTTPREVFFDFFPVITPDADGYIAVQIESSTIETATSGLIFSYKDVESLGSRLTYGNTLNTFDITETSVADRQLSYIAYQMDIDQAP